MCLPTAGILGIVGIVRDNRKWLAVLVTLVAGGLVVLPILIDLCL